MSPQDVTRPPFMVGRVLWRYDAGTLPRWRRVLDETGKGKRARQQSDRQVITQCGSS